MSFGADLDGATLTVVLDIRHPLAFLALGPAIEFGHQMDLRINWLPLATQPLNPPSAPGDADDRGVRHKRYRAEMIAREIAIYAEAGGLVVKEPYRAGAVDAAHLGWLWMRSEAPGSIEPFLQELFRGYWALELDAAEASDVARVVEACGGAGERFLAWADGPGPEVARRVAEELAGAGIFQTPAYVVDEEVFHGRQHLPMIRWILEGRTGAVPI